MATSMELPISTVDLELNGEIGNSVSEKTKTKKSMKIKEKSLEKKKKNEKINPKRSMRIKSNEQNKLNSKKTSTNREVMKRSRRSSHLFNNRYTADYCLDSDTDTEHIEIPSSSVKSLGLPKNLQIKPSKRPINRKKVEGIYAKRAIKAGTVFGPYMGRKVLEKNSSMDPEYIWEIFDQDSNEILYYIDATNPEPGTWMRYIRCARNSKEINLIPEQIDVDIFYRTSRPIKIGEEMLMYYSHVPLKKKVGQIEKDEEIEDIDEIIAEKNSKSVKKIEIFPKKDFLLDFPKKMRKVKPLPIKIKKYTKDLNSIKSTFLSKKSVSSKISVNSKLENNKKMKNKLIKMNPNTKQITIVKSSMRKPEVNRFFNIAKNLDGIKKSNFSKYIISSPSSSSSSSSSSSEPLIYDGDSTHFDNDGNYFFTTTVHNRIRDPSGQFFSNKFICDVCGIIYDQLFTLKRHFLRMHIDKRYLNREARSIIKISLFANYGQKEITMPYNVYYCCHCRIHSMTSRMALRSHFMVYHCSSKFNVEKTPSPAQTSTLMDLPRFIQRPLDSEGNEQPKLNVVVSGNMLTVQKASEIIDLTGTDDEDNATSSHPVTSKSKSGIVIMKPSAKFELSSSIPIKVNGLIATKRYSSSSSKLGPRVKVAKRIIKKFDSLSYDPSTSSKINLSEHIMGTRLDLNNVSHYCRANKFSSSNNSKIANKLDPADFNLPSSFDFNKATNVFYVGPDYWYNSEQETTDESEIEDIHISPEMLYVGKKFNQVKNTVIHIDDDQGAAGESNSDSYECEDNSSKVKESGMSSVTNGQEEENGVLSDANGQGEKSGVPMVTNGQEDESRESTVANGQGEECKVSTVANGQGEECKVSTVANGQGDENGVLSDANGQGEECKVSTVAIDNDDSGISLFANSNDDSDVIGSSLQRNGDCETPKYLDKKSGQVNIIGENPAIEDDDNIHEHSYVDHIPSISDDDFIEESVNEDKINLDTNEDIPEKEKNIKEDIPEKDKNINEDIPETVIDINEDIPESVIDTNEDIPKTVINVNGDIPEKVKNIDKDISEKDICTNEDISEKVKNTNKNISENDIGTNENISEKVIHLSLKRMNGDLSNVETSEDEIDLTKIRYQQCESPYRVEENSSISTEGVDNQETNHKSINTVDAINAKLKKDVCPSTSKKPRSQITVSPSVNDDPLTHSSHKKIRTPFKGWMNGLIKGTNSQCSSRTMTNYDISLPNLDISTNERPVKPLKLHDSLGLIQRIFICVICEKRFTAEFDLYNHQASIHPNIKHHHMMLNENRLPPWETPRSSVGTMNFKSAVTPDFTAAERKYICGGCNTSCENTKSLHNHIVNECSVRNVQSESNVTMIDIDPREIAKQVIEAKPYKMKSVKGRKKTPPVLDSEVSLIAARRRYFDLDDDSFTNKIVTKIKPINSDKKKKRNQFASFYDPRQHLRRRERMTLIDLHNCGGCKKRFETLTLLEKHVKICEHKDKLQKLRSIVANDGMEYNSSDGSEYIAFDPSKPHMCIYCKIKDYKYESALRNHVNVCRARKQFLIEEGIDILDREWEHRIGYEETTDEDSLSSLTGCSSTC